jgi:hypothetical protein
MQAIQNMSYENLLFKKEYEALIFLCIHGIQDAVKAVVLLSSYSAL